MARSFAALLLALVALLSLLAQVAMASEFLRASRASRGRFGRPLGREGAATPAGLLPRPAWRRARKTLTTYPPRPPRPPPPPPDAHTKNHPPRPRGRLGGQKAQPFRREGGRATGDHRPLEQPPARTGPEPLLRGVGRGRRGRKKGGEAADRGGGGGRAPFDRGERQTVSSAPFAARARFCSAPQQGAARPAPADPPHPLEYPRRMCVTRC
jgi:hypothetical protein